jgi:hypothetical protein
MKWTSVVILSVAKDLGGGALMLAHLPSPRSLAFARDDRFRGLWPARMSGVTLNFGAEGGDPINAVKIDLETSMAAGTPVSRFPPYPPGGRGGPSGI